MAYYAYASYTGTGAPQTLPLPFPYLDKAHVSVAISKVLYAAGSPQWSFINATSITVTAPAGAVVEVFRNTSQQARLVDYLEGVSLVEGTLDTDSLQAFYIAQEALDGLGQLNIRVGNVETGLASPVDYAGQIAALTTRVSVLESRGLGTGQVPMVFSTITASNTLALADTYTTILVNSTAAIVTTIPQDATVNFPIGTTIHFVRINTGTHTIAAASGATVTSAAALTARARWSTLTVMKTAANTWLLFGDVT
jgi:hypothetical protein